MKNARFAVVEAVLKFSRGSVRNIKATVDARKAASDLAPNTGTYLKANSPAITLIQSGGNFRNQALVLNVRGPDLLYSLQNSILRV